jgi:hypothetical protein
VVAF